MQQRLALTPLLLLLFCSFLTAQAKTTFDVRLSNRPNTLDWNVATSGSERAILQNLMRGLFTLSTDSSITGDLAAGYTWSPDQKRLEITLKSGETWNDGKALTAEHFVDSFERLLSPKLNSKNASLLFDVIGARDYFLGKSKNFSSVHVTAKDSKTLIFELTEPRSNFPMLLTHMATAPYRKDKPQATLGDYELQSQNPSLIVLRSKKPKSDIPMAQFHIVTDGREALQRFKSHELDYLLQIEDSLIPAEGAQFSESLQGVTLLHLNPNRINTDTPEKRRAIISSIAIENIIMKQAMAREKALSIIPRGLLGSDPARFLKPFPPKFSGVPLTLAYPPDEYSKTLAEQIQNASPGLKIKIEALPQGDLSQGSNRYDLVLTVFGLDYPDADQLLSSFLSLGTHDLFNSSPPELLKLIQKARKTMNVKERASIYRDAADLLQNRVSIVAPLFYRKRACVLSSGYRFEEGRIGTPKLSFIRSSK